MKDFNQFSLLYLYKLFVMQRTQPPVSIDPWWRKWNNIRTHLYLAIGLRAFLIAYGEYQVNWFIKFHSNLCTVENIKPSATNALVSLIWYDWDGIKIRLPEMNNLTRKIHESGIVQVISLGLVDIFSISHGFGLVAQYWILVIPLPGLVSYKPVWVCHP